MYLLYNFEFITDFVFDKLQFKDIMRQIVQQYLVYLKDVIVVSVLIFEIFIGFCCMCQRFLLVI